MNYDCTMMAYHGCDAKVARRLLDGESSKKIENHPKNRSSGGPGAPRGGHRNYTKREGGIVRKPTTYLLSGLLHCA